MHYEKVKAAAKDLTKIFSNLIICYYISGVSFFAHLPQIILDPASDVVNKAIMYCYLILIGGSMCMAARVNILVIVCSPEYFKSIMFLSLDLYCFVRISLKNCWRNLRLRTAWENSFKRVSYRLKRTVCTAWTNVWYL